jgi:hypothetical protein
MGKIYESIDEKLRNWLGVRSFIKVRLTRISDSCGYGVPLYEFRGRRSQLEDWAEHKGEESLVKYRQKYNSQSIDQLDGIGIR